MPEPIAISSAHGAKIGGAVGVLNEVTESRRLVTRIVEHLVAAGVAVKRFDENTATSVAANLNNIINWHNAQNRAVDCSVHFNAFKKTDKPMGVEVLYQTQAALANQLSAAIAKAGKLIDRKGKRRTDLAVLNRCKKPTVLLEVAFVDSTADASAYRANFEAIALAIAQTLSGKAGPPPEPPPEPEPEPEPEPSPERPTITVRVEPPGSAIVVVVDAAEVIGEV